MATFELNNGQSTDLKIDSKYLNTKIYISIDISTGTENIALAGRSRISCLYRETKDVMFSDYPIDYANQIFDKQLVVKVDATKFKVTEEDINVSQTPITCELIIEAGDDLLKKFSLNDNTDLSVNSIFIFKITFIN